MNLNATLSWRYTTKEYDSTKKLSAEHIAQIKQLLRMSPSSVNLQPWHFILAETEEGKKRVAKGAQGFFHFNEPKIRNAAAVVVFCSKTDVDEAYIQHLIETQDKDGRFPNQDIKNGTYGALKTFVDIHRYELKDLPHWLEKQVYLNMGSLLLGVASLGIDATPMEGIDTKSPGRRIRLARKRLYGHCCRFVGLPLRFRF